MTDLPVPAQKVTLSSVASFQRIRWTASIGGGLGVGALFFLSNFSLFPVILTVMLMLLLLVRARQLGIKTFGKIAEIDALFLAERYEECVGPLQKIIDETRRRPALKAIAMLRLAMVRIRLGHFDEAQVLFDTVLESGWAGLTKLGIPAAMLATTLTGRSTVAVLRGDRDARAWTEKAIKELGEAQRPLAINNVAILECREGNYDKVIALITDGFSAAEGMLRPRQVRQLRLIKAMAIEARAGSSYRAEASRDVTRAIDLATEGRDGEMKHLASQWPEFAEFLERHALQRLL